MTALAARMQHACPTVYDSLGRQQMLQFTAHSLREGLASPPLIFDDSSDEAEQDKVLSQNSTD